MLEDFAEVISSNLRVKYFNCIVCDTSAHVRELCTCTCVYAYPCIQLIDVEKSPFYSQITKPKCFSKRYYLEHIPYPEASYKIDSRISLLVLVCPYHSEQLRLLMIMPWK